MAFEVDYSSLDRLIHRLAFSAPGIQLAAADIERAAFARSYRQAAPSRPIFITSLPRAGTTVLLELLHRFQPLASHLYRDMPFVLAPILWSHLSGRFRKEATLRERAHKDGVTIGYDSPEAFEEVFWRSFWGEKYRHDRIALWDAAETREDARAFFAEHMQKIVALHRPEAGQAGRYLSKNNGNIARLGLLRTWLPDATILVPLRRPLEHAASLLRQHRNFIDLHRAEPFVRRYMADVGHYEFGALHRPIAFPGLDDLISGRSPLTLDYWLAYWVAAYQHVLSQSASLLLISHDALCATPAAALDVLCHRLGLDDPTARERGRQLLRSPAPADGAPDKADPALSARAEALHEALLGRCILGPSAAASASAA